MPKEQQFQPGRFQPVVELAQRDSGVPAPADIDFSGLEKVAEATLETSRAASRGFGSVNTDPTPLSRLAQIIGYVLAARNIVEQLLAIGVFTRLSTPIRNASVSPLEPLVRAYQYYGHFELDGKTYVGRGLENQLVKYLFLLKYYATPEVASGSKYTVSATLTFSDIDLDFYHISNTGEVAFGKIIPFKQYLLNLGSYIITELAGTPDVKLPLLKYLYDVTTETGLNNFIRTCSTLPGWKTPSRTTADEPTAAHKAAMKKLFGSEFSSDDDTIPVQKFTGSITNAYNTLRRVSLELSYSMKTMPMPKYEGGSAAQLAYYTDDVLVSQVPLSLSDSTAAVAFPISYGCSRLYKSAPAIEREELLRELVSQSLLPVR